MIKLERLERSACWELGQQIFKAGFASCAVIALILINSNIHQLVACIKGTPIAPPQSPCNERTFVIPSLNTTVKCCEHKLVKIVENGRTLTVYENQQVSQVLDWLNHCYNYENECNMTVFKDKTECKYVSKQGRNMLCFDQNGHLSYIVLNGFRMHKLIGQSIFSFLATMC